MPGERELVAFTQRAWDAGRAFERTGLPWRGLDDAYGVWVSESMLQQTQVPRVLARWPRFMAAFPTLDALAAASASDVLEAWQGLGYNRRALALKRAAETCARDHGGRLPRSREELLALPGIGPATAGGILAFAYQVPAVYIETNVREVFLHEFFPGRDRVPDRELEPLVARTCSQERPREWYYALLDWGARLKAEGGRDARRSASYARQGAFEGSRRQKRAFIVREVLAEPGIDRARLLALLNAQEAAAGRPDVDPVTFDGIVADLVREGFFDERLVP